jgi:hypothetical protein
MIMEDLLISISSIFSIFGTLKDVDNLPSELLPLTILFAGTGALILTKFTGNLGGLTLPVNASALFIGASVSNWLLQNVKLPLESAVEAPLAVSMIGMTLASFAMIWWLQGDDRIRS